MDIKVYLLKSFGTNENGGNPAGVVLNSEGLSDSQKKAISKDVGYSETAFVEKSNKADYKVTFFTPTDEVDLCGHATIATYSLLSQKGVLRSGHYTQELKAGLLGIKISNNGLVVMEQTPPIFSEILNLKELIPIFPKYEGVENLSP